MLEVEIDLIIYLGDMVKIVNVKICLGIDADFDGDGRMGINEDFYLNGNAGISRNVLLGVDKDFYLV